MSGRPGCAGRVVLDLRAAQSEHNAGRGIGRYCANLAAALVTGHRDLLAAIMVDGDRPLPDLPPDAAGLIDPAPALPAGGLLHLQAPFEPGTTVGELWPRAASTAGMSTVVTVYDLIPEMLGDAYLLEPGDRRRYRARRELVRAADHVVTLSRSAADDVVERIGIDRRRVTVIGGAPDPTFVPPADRDAARRAARAAVPGLGDRWIISTGALEHRKNLERLVAAYADLAPAVRDAWQLVLVGRLRESERHHFTVMADRLGIIGRLVLAGRVDDDLLRVVVQGADLAVMPSLYEGYGLPVAEAWACGTPAIASATSSLVELVPPEATFDPYDTASIRDAIAAALTDDKLRASLRAWAATAPPSWQDVADALAATYRRLLAARGR